MPFSNVSPHLCNSQIIYQLMCAPEIRDPMEKWKTTVPRSNFASYEIWNETSLSDKVSNFVACKLASFCIFLIFYIEKKEQFWFGMYFDVMTIVANEKCATFFHLCGFLWNVNEQYEYNVLYTANIVIVSRENSAQTLPSISPCIVCIYIQFIVICFHLFYKISFHKKPQAALLTHTAIASAAINLFILRIKWKPDKRRTRRKNIVHDLQYPWNRHTENTLSIDMSVCVWVPFFGFVNQTCFCLVKPPSKISTCLTLWQHIFMLRYIANATEKHVSESQYT